MNLRDLLQRDDVPGLDLEDLSEHTAEVRPNSAFIAVAERPSMLRDHTRAALAAGARVVLVADGRRGDLGELATEAPTVEVEDLARRRSALASHFYGYPSRQLDCIGVTGTNGKTSVAYYVAGLSESLGARCGYSGTLGWGFLGSLAEGDLTTSNAVAIQRRLAAMRDDGASRVAMEVSSHALDQERVSAVEFDTAIFTNLSRDHLDYHGTMEAYGEAKARLFTDFDITLAVVSLQSEFGVELARRLAGGDARVVTYGPGGDVTWRAIRIETGLRIAWSTPWGDMVAELPVVADFVVANVTAAIVTLLARGVELEEVEQALKSLPAVPGRLEVFGGGRDKPIVIVDYAHTPDAVDHVLAAVREFCSGKLVCVVGCGGDRDKGKRPLMAQAAARHSESVWLTSDNPRSEDPDEIIADMREGLDGFVAGVCADRREAICRAIREAGPGDVVLIAGKGHEDYQEIKGVRLPFSDRAVANEILAETA